MRNIIKQTPHFDNYFTVKVILLEINSLFSRKDGNFAEKKEKEGHTKKKYSSKSALACENQVRRFFYVLRKMQNFIAEKTVYVEMRRLVYTRLSVIAKTHNML